jgi:hypothetical protein
MYYPATLILNNYIPLQLETGMYFKSIFYPNTNREFTEIWQLQKYPSRTFDDVIIAHGYPVDVIITDSNGEILVYSEQIGWWDEGDQTDELRDITLTDINRILKEHQGNIEIDISNDAYQINQIVPTIAEDKVILRIPINEYDPEFDDLPDNEIEEEY